MRRSISDGRLGHVDLRSRELQAKGLSGILQRISIAAPAPPARHPWALGLLRQTGGLPGG
eukprot:6692500-Pyramimonas_sp.AAC.1